MALLDDDRPSYNDNTYWWLIFTYPIAFPFWFILHLLGTRRSDGRPTPLSPTERKERLRRHNQRQRQLQEEFRQADIRRERREAERAAIYRASGGRFRRTAPGFEPTGCAKYQDPKWNDHPKTIK